MTTSVFLVCFVRFSLLVSLQIYFSYTDSALNLWPLVDGYSK